MIIMIVNTYKHTYIYIIIIYIYMYLLMYHYVTLSRLMPRMQSFQEYRERPMDPVLGSVRPRGRWAAGWIGGIGGSVAVDSLR